MKIFLIKAFDMDNFRMFTPSVGAFVDQGKAVDHCQRLNNEQCNVLYSYKETELSGAVNIDGPEVKMGSSREVPVRSRPKGVYFNHK